MPRRTRRGRALLRFAMLLLLAVACPLAVARSPGAGGRDPAGLIAFVNGAGQVAVVDPATGEVAAFGAGPRQAIFPNWSHDGSRVAAVVASPGGTRVEVVDVSRGGDPVVVLSAPDRGPIYLNWSPDDRHMAVLSNTPAGALALDVLDVARAVAGAPEARSTLELGQPFYWVWSPTGRSVLVHRDVLRESALVGLTSIASFDVATPLPAPGAFQAPDISDSGRYVAYARRDGQGDRVVVIANPERGGDGAALAVLAHEGLVAFAWRPGHDQLSVQGVTTPGSFVGPVVLLGATGEDVRVVSSDQVVASFWSPDGRWLATLTVDGGGGGGEIAAGSEDLRRVQRAAPLLRVRFVDVDGPGVVDAGAFLLTPAFLSQYLPFFDQYSRSHSLWSPDSSALVLPVVGQDAEATLMVLGVDGTASELVPGDMPAWNLR